LPLPLTWPSIGTFVRRVGEHHRRTLIAEEPGVGRRIQRVAAEQLVSTELPQVSVAGDPGAGRHRGLIRVVAGDIEPDDLQVDLTHAEPGGLQVEVEVQFGEQLEVPGEHHLVPAAVLGQSVVGDGKGPRLFGGQMLEADDRDFAPAELATGHDPAVTGQNLAIAVNQDRRIERERLDAPGDLPNLRRLVQPCVLGIESEPVERNVLDGEITGWRLGEPGGWRHRWSFLLLSSLPSGRIQSKHRVHETEFVMTPPRMGRNLINSSDEMFIRLRSTSGS